MAYTVAELNGFSKEEFCAAVGFIFEKYPQICEIAYSKRLGSSSPEPFENVEELYAYLCRVVDEEMSEEDRVVLIQNHPDLVSRAAGEELTASSKSEQRVAGLEDLTAAEKELFNTQNKAYKEKFGFPFVICVRENKKEAIIAGFSKRIPNSREQEIATAIAEIKKIARLRLMDTVAQ